MANGDASGPAPPPPSLSVRGRPFIRLRVDVDASEVALQGVVARGPGSTVFRGVFAGRPVAVKAPRLATTQAMDRYHTELELLSEMDHPNVCGLVAARAWPPQYWLLFPFAELGSLADLLHAQQWRPTWQAVLRHSAELAAALAYLHAKGVVHRDGAPGEADFGLAERESVLAASLQAAVYRDEEDAEGKPRGRPSAPSAAPPSGGFGRAHCVGTLAYAPPEVLLRRVASFPADVFALGVVACELATSRAPYSDRQRSVALAHTCLDLGYSDADLAAAIAADGLRPRLPGEAPPKGAANDDGVAGGWAGAGDGGEGDADAHAGQKLAGALCRLVARCWAADPGARPGAADAAAAFGALVDAEEAEAEARAQGAGVAAGAPAAAAAAAAGPAPAGAAQPEQPQPRRLLPPVWLPPPPPPPPPPPAAHVDWLLCGGIEGDDGGSGGGGCAPGDPLAPPAWTLPAPGAYVPVVSAAAFACAGLRGADKMEDDHLICSPFPPPRPAAAGGGGGGGGGPPPHPTGHLFGVFDGHRGPEAARFCAARLGRALAAAASRPGAQPHASLAAAFVATHRAFVADDEARQPAAAAGGGEGGGSGGGAAAAAAAPPAPAPAGARRRRYPGAASLAVLVWGDSLYAANAGDCRAMVCRDGEGFALTRDHTCADPAERRRVAAAGGALTRHPAAAGGGGGGGGGAWRLGPAGLAVTRAVGDADCTPHGVTPEPEVARLPLEAGDEFVVLACDGLWDVMDEKAVAEIVRATVAEPGMAARRLVTEALARGSTDNVTALLAYLRPVSTCAAVWAEGGPVQR